jgi:hypothetical protein
VLKIILLLLSRLQRNCQTKSKAARAAGHYAPQDAQIEAEIRARLAKSVIGKDKFTVRVQGVAYWEGTTIVVQHKGSATRMAKSAGAKKVVNNIKVGDAANRSVGQPGGGPPPCQSSVATPLLGRRNRLPTQARVLM